MEFTEIFRLKDMLDEKGIAYVYTDESYELDGYAKSIYPNGKYEHYHIEVFNPANEEERIISVIQGSGSYGREQNLLEIMGCLTVEEEQHDSVLGYLTAEEVLGRIEKALGELK